jgi:hypothetical protein
VRFWVCEFLLLSTRGKQKLADALSSMNRQIYLLNKITKS